MNDQINKNVSTSNTSMDPAISTLLQNLTCLTKTIFIGYVTHIYTPVKAQFPISLTVSRVTRTL